MTRGCGLDWRLATSAIPALSAKSATSPSGWLCLLSNQPIKPLLLIIEINQSGLLWRRFCWHQSIILLHDLAQQTAIIKHRRLIHWLLNNKRSLLNRASTCLQLSHSHCYALNSLNTTQQLSPVYTKLCNALHSAISIVSCKDTIMSVHTRQNIQ